jgi:hypothetical protein
MALELIGKHSRAARHADVRAAIDILRQDGRVSVFAIGKIRRVKHGRACGIVKVKARLPSGLRLVVYAPDVIVEGVGH